MDRERETGVIADEKEARGTENKTRPEDERTRGKGQSKQEGKKTKASVDV